MGFKEIHVKWIDTVKTHTPHFLKVKGAALQKAQLEGPRKASDQGETFAMRAPENGLVLTTPLLSVFAP